MSSVGDTREMRERAEIHARYTRDAVSSAGASGDTRGMRREESARLESRQSGRSLKISGGKRG